MSQVDSPCCSARLAEHRPGIDGLAGPVDRPAALPERSAGRVGLADPRAASAARHDSASAAPVRGCPASSTPSAFGLLTAARCRPTATWRYGACLGWFAIMRLSRSGSLPQLARAAGRREPCRVRDLARSAGGWPRTSCSGRFGLDDLAAADGRRVCARLLVLRLARRNRGRTGLHAEHRVLDAPRAPRHAGRHRARRSARHCRQWWRQPRLSALRTTALWRRARALGGQHPSLRPPAPRSARP